jgi:Cd2+/Zn2+-exporting ATPase
MNISTDLAAIGFSEYEAKVYLALLEENPATGYQISKSSGVPRSMVYEALGRLSSKGAVLQTEERRATLYRPVPPDALLDRYLNEHRDRIRRLRTGLADLFTARDEDLVWSIKGAEAVYAYAAQLLDAAAREALLVLSDAALQALRVPVVAAFDRGVTLGTLLTGEGELDVGQVARHPPLESELQELTGMLVVVVDGSQVLIASGDGQTRATVSRGHNLVLIARQFVWMELFAQRVYARIGPDLLARLDPEDRQILEVYAGG